MLRLEKRPYTLYFLLYYRSFPFNFDSQENLFREMILFKQQVIKVEQSYFDSEDLTETLSSTFEVTAEERTQEVPLSSECMLLCRWQATSPHLLDPTKSCNSAIGERELTLASRAKIQIIHSFIF